MALIIRVTFGNVLFYLALLFLVLFAYFGALDRQRGVMGKFKDKQAYSPEGYYDQVDSLIRSNKLFIADGKLTLSPDDKRAQLFASKSFLRADIDRFNAGTEGIFRLKHSKTGRAIDKYNRVDYRKTYLARSRWLGRLSYRYPNRSAALLWNTTGSRLVLRRSFADMMDNERRLRPGAAQVPAGYLEHWDLDRNPQGTGRTSAYSWNVRLSGRTLLHHVSFYGMEDVVASIGSRVAKDVSLNGIALGTLLSSPGGVTRATRKLRLEDNDVLNFTHENKQDFLIFHHLTPGRPTPFSVVSSVRHTYRGQGRKTLSSPNNFMEFVVQRMEGVARSTPPSAGSGLRTADVELSMDAELERSMNATMKTYLLGLLENHPSKDLVVCATVLDGQTGEILAMPSVEADPLLTYNFNLQRHMIGSVAKVPLYACAFALQPTLARLQFRFGANGFSERNKFRQLASIPARQREQPEALVRVLGMKVKTFEETPGTPLQVDLESAIKFSSNVFAVTIALLSMIEEDQQNPLWNTLNQGGVNFTSTDAWDFNGSPVLDHHDFLAPGDRYGFIDRTPLARMLQRVFGVDPRMSYNAYYHYPWRGLAEQWGLEMSGWVAKTIEREFGNHGVAPAETALGLDLIRDTDDLRAEVITTVLGHSNNQWSNVKLAEAFARVFTRRRIEARFTRSRGEDSGFAAIDDLQDIPSSIYREFIESLRLPFTPGGTASGLATVKSRISRDGLLIYAKTGTARKRSLVHGMIVCVVARPNGKSATSRDLLVFVFYVQGRGLRGSSDAVKLASSVLPDALKIMGWIR